jgi:hypothetical protein
VKKKVSLSRRNLLLFGLPVLGLMLGLLGNFALVAPQKSKAQQLQSQLATVQAQVDAARHKPAAPAKAPKPKSVDASDLFQLTKAMPDSNDMAGILLDLSKLAAASNVAITSVTPTLIVPLSGYGALPLSVVLTGRYDQVAGFLQRLRGQVTVGKNGRPDAAGRLLVTNQVAMTSTDGRTVSATLNMDAFVYGAGAPPPAVTTGASGTTTTTTTASGG